MNEALLQLEERRNSVVEQIDTLVKELCLILEKDIPNAVLKQVRKAFIEDVEFAQNTSDVDLLEFKQKLHQLAIKLAEDCTSALLGDITIWLNQDLDAEIDNKTLEANTTVWAILADITPKVEQFIADYGLKAELAPYKTPMYFIDGKFAPGIIEKYWTNLQSLQNLNEEIKEKNENWQREKQAARWDNL